MNRQRSANAGIDNKVYRETVARMRQEVLESKAETQKVQDQLNCLIHLVKRAWLGDQAAAIHVANIIGVAPPDTVPKQTFHTEIPSTTFITQPKPRAINNWAMLTIGLLNKFYKQLEREAEEEAKRHLTTRIDYLEELLIHHKSMLGIPVTMKPRSVGDVDREFIQQRLRDQKVRETGEKDKHLKRRNPVHHHLYRPASGKSSNENIEMDAETVDFFVHPQNQSKVANGNSDDKIRHVSSERYVQPGLFDTGDIIPDRKVGKRPASAKVQQQSDSMRARPKSAVLPKSERPLKYETTRPISAKVSSTTTANRAKSAKGNRTNEEKKKKSVLYFPVETTNQFAHNDTVSDDLKKVQQMEEEFRQRAKVLQQKLGISNDGAI